MHSSNLHYSLSIAVKCWYPSNLNSLSNTSFFDDEGPDLSFSTVCSRFDGTGLSTQKHFDWKLTNLMYNTLDLLDLEYLILKPVIYIQAKN